MTTDREVIAQLREDLELERVKCTEKEKTIGNLEDEVRSMTAELRKLRNDCNSLQTQLNKEREAYSALDRQRISLLKDIETDSARVNALRNEVHDNELRELRNSMRREQAETARLTEALSEANQLVSQLRDELDEAQTERARAERRANADRRASSLSVIEIERDREAAQRRIAELLAEVERLRSERQKAESGRDEIKSAKSSFAERERSLTAALNDLEARCTTLSDRCSVMERERNEAQQRMRETQREADDRVAEIATRCATLIDSLESTRSQLDDATKRLVDSESGTKLGDVKRLEELETVAKRVAELEETVTFLKEERDDLRRRNARYFDEKMEKHEKARTLERENRELKQKLDASRRGEVKEDAALKERSTELESAKTRVRELESKLADSEKLLESALLESERRVAEVEKRAEQRVTDAEKRVEARGETATLRERVRELETREAAAQKLLSSESRATLAAAENRARSLKEKLDLVQSQLDSAKWREKKLTDELEGERDGAKRLEQLEKTHANCEADTARLQEKMKLLEAAVKRMESELTSERDALRKTSVEKERVTEELRTVRARHTEADVQHSQLLKEFNVVKDSFAEADRQLSVFEKMQEQLEVQRTELKDNVRVLRTRLDEAEKQLTERASQLREAQQNWTQAQETIKLLTHSSASEADLLRKAGEQYRTKIAQLEMDTLKLTKQHGQAETRIKALEDELRLGKEQLRRTQSELQTTEKERVDIEKRLVDSLRKCGELSGSLDEAIMKYEALLEEKVELEEHLANIQRLFDTEEFTHNMQMQQTAKLIEFVQENTRKLEKLRKKTAKQTGNKKETSTPAATLNRASWNPDTIKRNSALLSTPLASKHESVKIGSARLALTAAQAQAQARSRPERVPETPTPRLSERPHARERTPDRLATEDANESSYASHTDDPPDADGHKHAMALAAKSPSKRHRMASATNEPLCIDSNANPLAEASHALLDSSAYIPLQNGSTRTIAASTTSASSSSSSAAPGPHQLVRGVNTKSCTCAVCLGVIQFTKDAFKCEKCHHMCHPECQDMMASWYTCGSLLEVQQAYRCVVTLDTELVTTDGAQSLELMRGFVKVPTRSTSFGEFWESRFLVLDRSRVSMYDSDPRTPLGTASKPSRVSTIQLGGASGSRLFVQTTVNSRTFPTVVHNDIACMFKLCTISTASNEPLPTDQLVVLCSSLTEKHRWCAALSYAINQAQLKAALAKGVSSIDSLVHVDSILRVNTRMKVPSGSRPSKKTQRLDLLATHALSATDFLLIGTERGLYAHKATSSVMPTSAFSTPTLVRVTDFREPVFIMRELQTDRAELFVWVAGSNRALYAVQLQRMRNRVFESRDAVMPSKSDVTKSPGGSLSGGAKKLRSEPWEFPVVHVQSLVGCLAFETYRNSNGCAYAACATIDRILILQFTYQQEVPDGSLLRTADGFTLIDEIVIERPCTSLLLENERIIYSYDTFYSKRLSLIGQTISQSCSQTQINRFVLADALNSLSSNSRAKALLTRIATPGASGEQPRPLTSGTGVLQFAESGGPVPIAAFAYASRDTQTYHVLIYNEFGFVVNETGECASRDVEIWPGTPNAVTFRQPLLILFYPVGAQAYRVRRDASTFRFEFEPLGALPYVAPRCLQLGSTPTTNSANPLLVSTAVDHECVEVLQLTVKQ